MSVLPPATIAIIGAGPVGVEAALYARFLGYDVRVYDRGRIADSVRRWGHVRLFSPFGMNVSSLGRAAIQAQDPEWQPPDDDALLTGREFAAAYLLPLAATDLLRDHVHENTEVVAVGRSSSLKHELVGQESRGDDDFRILVRNAAGQERVDTADVVIDASGTYGHHNWLGQGGIAAVGETAACDAIAYELPDVLGDDRRHYAGRRVLVVGGGYSAATTIVSLAQLARDEPGTSVVWVTRPPADVATRTQPIVRIPQDRLTARDTLAAAANALAADANSPVEYRPNRWVRAIARDEATGALSVELSAGDEPIAHDAAQQDNPQQDDPERRTVEEVAVEQITVDQIIANVGYRPDHRLSDELQLHRCYASDGPMKLAAALLAASNTTSSDTRVDCLDQSSPGPAALLTPEPDFYVLGAKSFGRNSQFLLSVGLEQVRDLFTIIGDREDLDLYRTTALRGGVT
ncbi:MAG: NAD(P)-binding domain-containing protein [Pirellulales bacterium]